MPKKEFLVKYKPQVTVTLDLKKLGKKREAPRRMPRKKKGTTKATGRVRNFRREYLMYHASPEQKKKRAARNKARSVMAKAGKVRKGDGKHVDHKRSLKSGGTSARSNLRVLSASANLRRNSKNGGRPKGGRKALPKRK